MPEGERGRRALDSGFPPRFHGDMAFAGMPLRKRGNDDPVGEGFFGRLCQLQAEPDLKALVGAILKANADGFCNVRFPRARE